MILAICFRCPNFEGTIPQTRNFPWIDALILELGVTPTCLLVVSHAILSDSVANKSTI